jgi:cell division protein FtsW
MSTIPMAKSYESQAGQEAGQSKVHPLFLQIDVPLLIVVIILVVIGLLMVYSTSWGYAIARGQQTSYMVLRQILWVGLGGLALFALSRFDYHRFQRWLIPMMGGTLLMLFTVLWISEVRFGATRTLFSGSIQPSEMAKLTGIIYLSFWLNSKRFLLHKFSLGLLPMAVILGITSGLILLQPDLSAAFTIIIMGGLLFFIAGGDIKQILVVVIVTLLMIWLMITISNTGRARLEGYLVGLQSPMNATYHVRRAMESVVRGGWFGVGIGNGSTKLTGLPVPWTDSIFAVIAEETGIFGAVFVVILYLLFLWRGLKIAQDAADLSGKLLASGITLWISLEALINMGVLINLLPFAGNALPLVSAGGSSMVTALASIGILMNIAKSSTKPITLPVEGRLSGAIVDLRGRDRRGRVPRTGRTSNPE